MEKLNENCGLSFHWWNNHVNAMCLPISNIFMYNFYSKYFPWTACSQAHNYTYINTQTCVIYNTLVTVSYKIEDSYKLTDYYVYIGIYKRWCHDEPWAIVSLLQQLTKTTSGDPRYVLFVRIIYNNVCGWLACKCNFLQSNNTTHAYALVKYIATSFNNDIHL